MRVTKCGKAVAYAVLAACFLALAVWITAPMHNTTAFVTAYWRSDVLLFLLSCSVLGAGVYSFVAYTRRHPAHRVDSWFLIAVGAVMLVFTVIVILRFGGISEENFDTTANAALNLNLVLAGVLPIPFAVRSWILACTAGFSKRERAVAIGAAAVVTAVYLLLAVNGRLLFTVEYITK